MKFNICVAIQVKSGNFKDSEKDIKKALEAKADLIELRLDYINSEKNLTFEFIQNLISIIRPEASVILTLRDASEGGHLKISEDERLVILERMVNANPDYIDIEIGSNDKILKKILDWTSEKHIRLILSSHDFHKTPTFEEGSKIIEVFINRLLKDPLFDPVSFDNLIYKLIFTAQIFEDNFIPLKICKEISKENKKIISFCMGDEGIFSRITCVNFGSSFTYASIAESTAPGQINIKAIREVVKLLFSGE